MTNSLRHLLRGGVLALALATTIQASWAEEKMVSLFKIVTVKDEVVIGLSADELAKLGGKDAGAVAHALKTNGELSAWQYAVKKAANGDLQQAPLRKIGLLAHDSLRVEPYSSPLTVLPHE
jgi:hypothetical protein